MERKSGVRVLNNSNLGELGRVEKLLILTTARSTSHMKVQRPIPGHRGFSFEHLPEEPM
ncbi:hypothetical protein HAX54_037175, partial [Datura stramonium]|nr:hypothetical protein [Datura stramonium]